MVGIMMCSHDCESVEGQPGGVFERLASDTGALLASLAAREIELWLDDGQLRFRAPKGILSAEELTQLRSRRAELIELLEQLPVADVPLQRRPTDGPVRLTPGQEGWQAYIDAHQNGLTERMCYSATRITGALDTAALARCLTALVQRREPLRMRLVRGSHGPALQIDPPADCQPTLVDCAATSLLEAEREVARQGEEFVRGKIVLATDPLFATRLFRLAADQHVLILALEHMIADATSLIILQRDLWAMYDQATRGSSLQLPPLTLQFADYLVWQHSTYRAWLGKHQGYWKEHLGGVPGLRVPYDAARPVAMRGPCLTVRVPLGPALTGRLRELARRQQTLLPWMFLTIYAAVVGRWCRQDDFVLMFISNGRHRPELDGMVGDLSNMLHLRVGIRSDDTFATLLQKLSAELRGAYEHQDFNRLSTFMPECATELDFNWTATSWMWEPPRMCGGLMVEPFPLDASWERAFLPLFFDTPAGIIVSLTYRSDLLASETIKWLGRNLRVCAELVAQDQNIRLASIQMR